MRIMVYYILDITLVLQIEEKLKLFVHFVSITMAKYFSYLELAFLLLVIYITLSSFSSDCEQSAKPRILDPQNVHNDTFFRHPMCKCYR